MASNQNVRGGWKAVMKGSVGGWFAKSLVGTLRVDVVFECEGPLTDKPRIFSLWHNNILSGASAAKHWLEFRSAVVLTSASRDGASLAAAMECFEIGAVRGSSSRRGAAALLSLVKALEKGKHVVITPDGPKGPRHEIQPGIIKLAEKAGVPIIPFHVECESCWELSTWDRLQIPKPFSRVKVVFGEELEISTSGDEDDFERQRKLLEKVMSRRLNGRR